MDKKNEKEKVDENGCESCKYFPYNNLIDVDNLSLKDIDRIKSCLGGALDCLETMERVFYRVKE